MFTSISLHVQITVFLPWTRDVPNYGKSADEDPHQHPAKTGIKLPLLTCDFRLHYFQNKSFHQNLRTENT